MKLIIACLGLLLLVPAYGESQIQTPETDLTTQVIDRIQDYQLPRTIDFNANSPNTVLGTYDFQNRVELLREQQIVGFDAFIERAEVLNQTLRTTTLGEPYDPPSGAWQIPKADWEEQRESAGLDLKEKTEAVAAVARETAPMENLPAVFACDRAYRQCLDEGEGNGKYFHCGSLALVCYIEAIIP